MDIVRRDEQGRYVIRVELNDGLSYWYFSLKNAQLRYNILTAEIGDNVTYNTHRNSYDGREAYGTIVSNRNTGIESLRVHL